MPSVLVIGGSGFIGSACIAALQREGFDVASAAAPRLPPLYSLHEWLQLRGQGLEKVISTAACTAGSAPSLLDALGASDVLVNAAGLARATGGDDEAMLAANGVLPAVLSALASKNGVRRFVHISSAAVQGDMMLDESVTRRPFSQYSRTKALGETLLGRAARVESTVCFRPTSVHGPARAVTRQVARLARSPFAVVSAPGDDPTPQVHVTDTAAYVVHLCREGVQPPPITLQPWAGFTTASFIRALGGEPRLVPRAVAEGACQAPLGRVMGSAVPYQRRAKLLLLGQRQRPGFLDQLPSPGVGRSVWEGLAKA